MEFKNHSGARWNVYRPDGKHFYVFTREGDGNSELIDKNKITLVCKAVMFYCDKDEILFFQWLKRVECVEAVSVAGDELHLHIKSKRLSYPDLNDLIGLFYRYKIDMKQLSQFLNKNNTKWFYDNKKAFWHRRVFGDSKLLVTKSESTKPRSTARKKKSE